MDKYPFNTTSCSPEDTERFKAAYDALKTRFDIEVPGHIDFQLKQFDVFKGCREVKPEISLVIRHLNCDSYIFFIEIPSGAVPAKGKSNCDGYEYQTWALAYLKKDFGRVLIRRETLADKLIELVHPVELDFNEDKAFSDTFYVLVNDLAKAKHAMDRNFRNAMMDLRHHDFVLEIFEHSLIVGNKGPISAEMTVSLAEFVSRVASSC